MVNLAHQRSKQISQLPEPFVSTLNMPIDQHSDEGRSVGQDNEQTPRALRPTIKPKHLHKLPKQMMTNEGIIINFGGNKGQGCNSFSLKQESMSVLFKAPPKTQRTPSELVGLSKLRRNKSVAPIMNEDETNGRITNFVQESAAGKPKSSRVDLEPYTIQSGEAILEKSTSTMRIDENTCASEEKEKLYSRKGRYGRTEEAGSELRIDLKEKAIKVSRYASIVKLDKDNLQKTLNQVLDPRDLYI